MKRTIDALGDLRGKKVFLRVDFNVPVEGGRVADDYRIRNSLPTIKALADKGAKLILASHLGRPKGSPDPKYSMAPVAKALGELLGKEVAFTGALVGPEAQKAADALGPGEVLLLENLRFHPGEQAGDEDFAKELRALADSYVNDAFGTAHRKDTSVYLLPTLFQEKAAGLLMAKEVEALWRVRENPQKPFVVIMGGAKVSDKIAVMENLLNKADKVLIGGGMAYTFLKAKGLEVGKSIIDQESLEWAEQALKKWKDVIVLPVDHVVGQSPDVPGVVSHDIPSDAAGFDVGPETVELFKRELAGAKTVFWNGPLGVFEKPGYERGTIEIAHYLKDLTSKGCFVVTGGGDTVSAIHHAGLRDEDFSHVSTGGGATLEFLGGIDLPGLAVLPDE
ncbi:MAG: phosphoglycerate kinase [candidate division WOR-3 bacterium]